MLSRDALLGLGFCRLRTSSRLFPTPCKCCGKPILVSFAHSVLFPTRVPSDHIVLLFSHLFSSYVRSFSRCARVFGIKGVSGLFASYSQVREARTLLFGIKMLAWMSFSWFSCLYVTVNVWCELICCLKMELCWWQRGTVAESDRLAQANLSRLGESYRDSPKCFFAKGRPGDPLYVLGERTSRLSEESLA